MPVFTAIAAEIIAVVGGIEFAAAVGAAGVAFATSVVAAGLAIVTARLVMGVGAQGGGSGSIQSQGTRQQLPPASENKIPVVYGNAFQQGIVTDAHISNENKTMTYTLALSEYTTSTWTVNNVYWNDQRLNYRADGYTVDSTTGSDGTTSTSYSGLIRTWVWAGNGSSANQIFGPSPAVNAWDVVPDTTSTYLLQDTVFAVMQIDYSSDKGITSLQNVTFNLTNSLSNPGDVWLDYMTNSRYGAGISINEIDVDSATGSTATSLKSISNQIPPNQFQTDGVTTSTQVRYTCNGVINTVDTVKTNIDKINLASSSWTTYDHKTGLWRVVPNRKLSELELESVQVFDDDNIIGQITVSATNLEDIYNELEVTYANRGLKDQTDYFKASVDPAELNALEPRNLLRMKTDLCNNGLQAARIGLIELRQSRADLVITFQADYTGLQAEAGDVIKVTNDVYGFDNKLFRVTRVRETEGGDGQLASEITALEYVDTIYTDSQLIDGQDKPASDIPTQGSSGQLPAPSTPTFGAESSGAVPSFIVNTTVSPTSGPVELVELWYSTSAGSGYQLLESVISGGGTFAPGEVIYFNVSGVPAGTYYFKARTSLNGLYSSFSAASSAKVWNPVYDYGPI